jgi:hypothetical protein
MDMVGGRLVVSGCRRRGGEHCNGRFDVQHGHGAHRPRRWPRWQGRGQRGVSHPFARDTHHLMHVRGSRTLALHFAVVGTLVHFGAAGRHQTHSHARAKPKTALGSSALRYARTSPSPCGQAQSRPGDPPLPSLCISLYLWLFRSWFVIFFLSFLCVR